MTKAENILKGIINELESMAPKVATEIGQELLDITPTDTTHAIENWQTTIDGKNTNEIGEYPGHGGGRAVAEMNMWGSINSFNGSRNSLIRFDMNVDYFEALDTKPGHSRKAPDGVTDPATDDVVIKRALNKIRF